MGSCIIFEARLCFGTALDVAYSAPVARDGFDTVLAAAY